MPPRNPNPAAGKRPANTRVRPSVRADGTKVKGHTRDTKGTQARDWARRAWTSTNATRMRRTAAGTGTAGVMSALILTEFGFTLISTVAVAAIALVTCLAVLAGELAESNQKTLSAQQRRRTTARTGQRKTAPRSTTTRRTPPTRRTR